MVRITGILLQIRHSQFTLGMSLEGWMKLENLEEEHAESNWSLETLKLWGSLLQHHTTPQGKLTLKTQNLLVTTKAMLQQITYFTHQKYI